MRITGIEDFSKSKKTVFIDDEIAFVLYKGDLPKYNLRVDTDITEETINEVNSILDKRAKLRCLKLLEVKDYTYKQLKDKLKRDGYSDSTVTTAIDYIDQYGYLDDYRYSVGYAEGKLKRKSFNEVRNLLLQKGIKSETIDEAFTYIRNSGEVPSEIEVIMLILSKKHFNDEMDYDNKNRLINYIVNKGFNYSDVQAAMKSFTEE